MTTKQAARQVAPAARTAGSSWATAHARRASRIEIQIGGATITVTSVTQDEPTNGLGVGDPAVDAVIDDGTVLLRSERSGNGNGRVYHIHFTASDLEGSASGVVSVSVPHDKKSVAIDGGELYNSTQ